MAKETAKTETPPYATYSTFTNFINGLKETGVPSRIDKSVLSKMSGSAQAALLSGLKWLVLIDSVGVPNPKLDALVNADATHYSEILAGVLRERYPFLTDGSLNIAKASGAQVEQKFRDFGISGSTVTKCVAFFIAAAKEAKIALSPHVKAPKATISNTGLKRQQARKLADAAKIDREDEGGGVGEEKPGFVKIHIPLHGMPDGVVYLPDELPPEQWAYALKITKFLLENYRSDTPANVTGEKPS
jgi:hypothetical protein